MAEAIVSAVVGEAVSRVISLVIGNFFSHQQSTEEVKLQRIRRLVIRIHSVVVEAKGRQIENGGVLQWLSELIDGEYEGRYLLDTIGCSEHDELEDQDEKKSRGEVSSSSLSSLFNPAKRMRVAATSAVKSVLISRRALGDGEVERVLESLQGVSGDLAEFIMLLQGCQQQQQQIRRPLATNIFLEAGQMFGRHVEKERIINFLLHDGDDGRLGVLPIVGDIGVGKTTLVQHACDDQRVRHRFPVIILFNFSCTYATAMSDEATVVLRYKHVIGDAGVLDMMNDPLQSLIKRDDFGSTTRFLMVFEDVDMRKKQMLEEELLPSLSRCGNKKGSKIMFTTNNSRVASNIGTIEPIILKVLPHPEYWFFFKAHAFAGRDVEENPKLMAAGKAIARKLNGSFFGAKIVGGLLKDHPETKFWCKVLRGNIGGLSFLGDGLAYIADLAENLLPINVNMCHVTISKDRYSSQTELSRFLQDLCDPCGSEATTCLAHKAVYSRVLLCRSVLPFYNLHYIASCTIDSEKSCSAVAVV